MNEKINSLRVETKNVDKIFKSGAIKVKALKNISLKVKKGEFVSIIGPSGSGKSTLLHLIGALDSPSEGEIYLDGSPYSGLSGNELADIRRERIGFIFQQFNLLPTLTAFENASLPLLLTGKTSKKDKEKITQLLSDVGLASRFNHKPDELSGGEMQRVAIARALAVSPSVILADEPTGNLDSKTGEEILSLLKQCQNEFGQTLFLVTHDSRAAAYGDRIITMKDGHIIEDLDALGQG